MYYGIYQGSRDAKNACIAQLVTAPQDGPGFPAAVNYECNLCHNQHMFRLMRSQIVSTPRQQVAFAKWIAENSAQSDVEISSPRSKG